MISRIGNGLRTSSSEERNDKKTLILRIRELNYSYLIRNLRSFARHLS
jgi:hypothetical protein